MSVGQESGINPAAGRPQGPVVDLHCPQCEVKLRLPEADAHKQIRCPACRAAFRLGENGAAPRTPETPGGAPPLIAKLSSPPSPGQAHPRPHAAEVEPIHAFPGILTGEAANQWYVKTAEGELYGPAPQSELREWIAEGRIDDQCQILRAGWKQWQWADEVFPELEGISERPSGASHLFTLTTPRRPEAEIEFDKYGLPHVKPDDPFAAEADPFQDREEEQDAESTAAPSDFINEPLRRAVREVRPYLSVVASIGAVLGVLAVIYGYLIFRISMDLLKVDLIFVGFSYMLGGALAIWTSWRLMRVGRAIGWFIKQESPRMLQGYLQALRAFWQIACLFCVVTVFLAVMAALLLRSFGSNVTLY